MTTTTTAHDRATFPDVNALLAADDQRKLAGTLLWFAVADAAAATWDAGHLAEGARQLKMTEGTLRKWAFAARRFPGPSARSSRVCVTARVVIWFIKRSWRSRVYRKGDALHRSSR